MANLFNAIPQFGGGGGFAGYGLFVDQKTAGTPGGTFTSGAWRTRTINTELYNNLTSASLSSNQITLGAGDYVITSRATAYKVNRHATRLYDVSNTAVLVSGSSEYAALNDSHTSQSSLKFYLSLAVPTIISVQHLGQNTRASDGFGINSSPTISVANEVYLILEIIEL